MPLVGAGVGRGPCGERESIGVWDSEVTGPGRWTSKQEGAVQGDGKAPGLHVEGLGCGLKSGKALLKALDVSLSA